MRWLDAVSRHGKGDFNMKSIISLSVFLFSGASFAASLTCGQLVSAYKRDLMNEAPYECKGNKACEKRQLAQLRETVKYFTPDDYDSSKSLKDLTTEYQAYFKTILVGKIRLEEVNIDLGDNPFALFFYAGTADFSGVSSTDGTIEVNGEYCKEDFSFEPYVNASRRHAICREVVPLVREELPKTTFNHKVCTNEAEVDEATRNRTDFRVEKFTENHVWLNVSRNLHDQKGGYFSCKVRVSRTTNKVVAGTLACDIH